MAQPKLTAKATTEQLALQSHLFRARKTQSFVPILPLLSLKGKSYSLNNYPPFEPIYRLRLAKRTLYKCGRQVSKTTNMSAQGVLHCASQAHFAMLFVAPRYEQVRRVSSNYVKPFVDNSLLRSMMSSRRIDNSVLQKSFLNESRMYFSFAFLDADRIRGLSVDSINYDEIQDIDLDFVPVIRECMSASIYGVERFFGTPKTLDNTIQVMWEQSSQAEWIVTCPACGTDNIPGIEYHLLEMIGPSGPICWNCGLLIDMRRGRWIHAVPARMSSDPGYHVPQIILPMHYEDPEKPGQCPEEPSEKWIDLLAKRDGRQGFNRQMFMNEVLGESCDVGVKLVTLTDIRNVSVLHRNERRTALDVISTGKYRWLTLGVDWGGGGIDMISTTTAAVCGYNLRTGKVEVVYTQRLHAAYSHDQEAKQLLDMFRAFRCHLFCHDYGGAGSVRETLMIQAGLPINKIMGLSYVRASVKKMIEVKRPSGYNQRTYYTLDKARSLVLQATCIKAQHILFPEYESSKEITHDLLALFEDRREPPGKADIFVVSRNPKLTDDFSHALNFGCIGLWHALMKRYPDLSRHMNIKLTKEQANFVHPPNPAWEENVGDYAPDE